MKILADGGRSRSIKESRCAPALCDARQFSFYDDDDDDDDRIGSRDGWPSVGASALLAARAKRRPFLRP